MLASRFAPPPRALRGDDYSPQMDRLHRELHRLYAPRLRGEPDARPGLLKLVAADGRLRAIVLEVARPADWDLLAAVWKGVQTELELPAPAIAVNGQDERTPPSARHLPIVGF